jgi:hypothetical protein
MLDRNGNTLLVLLWVAFAPLAGCPTHNGVAVDDARPADTCFLPSAGLPQNRVYQTTTAGCALMTVYAIWDESTPAAPMNESPIRQSGVRSTTRIFFSRESCERVQELGTATSEGGVEVQFLRTGTGFIAATLVEPATPTTEPEVLLSASIDFTVDGLEEVQTVRIMELPLHDGETCTSF